MLLRLLMALLLVVALLGSGWAKDSIDAATLMSRSDALYYYPSTHGATDIAVDVLVDQFAADPLTKSLHITYYYADEARQRFSVDNLPADPKSPVRARVEFLRSSLGEYIMPRTSKQAFEGMKVKSSSVYRQFKDIKETQYFLLVGKAENKDAPIKEYRVLVDKAGLVYEVENVAAGGPLTARIENIRHGDFWFVSKLTTNLTSQSGWQWKIDNIEYEQVKDFWFPSRVVIQFRNAYNQPVKELPDITIQFRNYRINEGVAAKALPAKEETTPPGAAPTPEKTN